MYVLAGKGSSKRMTPSGKERMVGLQEDLALGVSEHKGGHSADTLLSKYT